MDFKAVIGELICLFDKRGIRYALIGGFALGLWGSARATVDIDLLINRDDLEKADSVMLSLGYRCSHKSDNVSQYISDDKMMGEVDFLHAFREASLGMLERSAEKDIFNGALKIKVVSPEDLIGLKVQAIKNDPERERADMADIESLLSRHGKTISWELIEEYCTLFDMGEVFKRLRRKYS